MTEINIIPVIMSGGAGTRLWPASRQATPKQLLPLISEQTMIQETAKRLRGAWDGFSFGVPVIVCNTSHAASITKQLGGLGIKPGTIITEPVPRNTAPCAAIAALAVQAQDPDALMLLAPADHHINNKPAFAQVVTAGLAAAEAGYLVTFGITAETPETGYGYIQKGAALDDHAFKVAAFKEKPRKEIAEEYITSGAYFWNAGIFMCKPSVLLAEMKKHCPDILATCEIAYSASAKQGGILSLDEKSFAACPADSIDYAVMERTDKAAVVEANMGWSDIGSWSALWERTKDESGNAHNGDVHTIDTTNSLIHTDGPFVATIGIDNLAVIVHQGAILVANMDKVQDVKKVVDFLKARGDTAKL
ncbi:MAG: mannose-1-phosphate guanylyltransferase/mannose-6-phosphate isomerase [Robiginitomaculum sp.]|nr:mannose-1-phosphate guanylyltransferase/mannose-6-phosphate isomerase [Robiginitomaculum sp.]